MTKRVILLSIACGIAWHIMLMLLIGVSIGDALTWRLLSGVVAGLVGGALTISSRIRHGGKEKWFEVLAAYYIVAGVYWLSAVPFVVIYDGSRHWQWSDMLVAACGVAFYAGPVATVVGVVFLPLSYATRLFVWRFRGPMHDGAEQ